MLRADLSALEEAHAYQALMEEFSLTQDEVAKRIGKSRPAITNTLRPLQAPGGAQRAPRAGSPPDTRGRCRRLRS